MTPYPNLISESLLINETIDLVRAFGGRVSAVQVVDYVMRIRKPDPALARLLVLDLIERDPRLGLNGNDVELEAGGIDERTLAETEFVVFDLETTGTRTPPCRITEIGAYLVREGRVADEFQTLVNPEMPIPPFISMLTGITNEMVSEAPNFSEVAPVFLEFIGDSILVAHNAPFDMRFLNHEIGRVFEGYRLANPCLCTVKLSRKLLPDALNHRLKTLAEFYSIDLINHHRAGEDAFATAHIFVNFLEQLESGGVSDLATVKVMGSRKGAYAG